MRREFLLITFLLTILYSDFARAQSLSPDSSPNASRINLKDLTKKAASGNTESQLQLGYAYQFGNGVEKDISASIRWYRRAADNGDPLAQNNLGYLYETGPEGVRNIDEAAKWYMRAAVYGNPAAQFNIGLFYLRGKGLKQSAPDALYWIQRAADVEYSKALAALGYIY